MSLVRMVVRDAAIGVAVTDAPEGLCAIRTPGSAAAIWRRRLPQSFQTWIDGLPPGALPKGRIVLHPGAVREAVDHLCDVAEMPSGAERDRLTDDVAALGETFCGVMDARRLRLRLAPVDTDSCRRFHVDAVRARLVYTYRGLGTQYGVSIAGAAPGRVFSVATGAPILLRGSLWPGEATGLMHRSPTIEGTGTTRFVLVLDAVDDPEEDA